MDAAPILAMQSTKPPKETNIGLPCCLAFLPGHATSPLHIQMSEHNDIRLPNLSASVSSPYGGRNPNKPLQIPNREDIKLLAVFGLSSLRLLDLADHFRSYKVVWTKEIKHLATV